MSEQLNAPIITAEVFDTVKIRVSGLAVENASGYMLRFGNLPGYGVENVVTPAEGVLILPNNRMRVTYYIQARALGDDENYTSSDWSEPVAVTTGGIIDNTIPIPTLPTATVTYTTLNLSSTAFSTEYGVRWQCATTAEGVESAPIKILGIVQNALAVFGLTPGTTYYYRICYAGANKVGLWSEIKSSTTNNTTSTAVVTNANDSGTGSLRAVYSSAAAGTLITFDPSLSGETITLASNLSLNKNLIIDGSALETKIKITTTENFGFSTGTTTLIGLWLDNLYNTYGIYVGCEFTGSMKYFSSACRCTFSGISQLTLNSRARFQDCIGYDFSKSFSGGPVFANCFFNLAGSTAAYPFYQGTAYGCLITGKNSGTSLGSNMTLWECDVKNNNVTGALLTNCNYWVCRLEDNGNSKAITIATSEYCKDTYIGYGVETGSFQRCIIAPPAGVDAIGTTTSWNATTLRDCLVLGNCTRSSSTTYYGCTIKKITAGSAYNSLFGPGSTASGSNNLLWDETDESAANYVDKVFADFSNGDYHLKYGSTAFDAGNVQHTQTDETDLDGNPRVVGDRVDVGCYELINFQLAPPVITLTTGAGGQGTISYNLPAGGSAGIVLNYADNADFTNAQEITATTAGISLTGMSGTVYFRAKLLGIEGLTLDSNWSDTVSGYFDAVSPIIIVDITPIEMVVGDEVNFLAGVVVTDDVTEQCEVHYQVLDRDNQPIEVDGKTTDIDSSGIPVNPYTLVITASDDAGNIATASRQLKVYRPMLSPPVISLDGVGKYGAEISGLVNTNASGWLLKTDGLEMAVAPVLGKVTVTGLNPATTHVFQAKAIGDFDYETYTGEWRDSDWSNEISIQQESVSFFKWTSETVLSHDGRTLQNVEFKAKIKDADTGELLPPILVSGAVFTAYYVVNGERTEIEGFSGVNIPLSAFSATAKEDGFNFHFVPDQTAQRLLRYPGYYVFQIAVTLTAGNPFNIYSEPIPIF